LFWRAGERHAARVGDWKLVNEPQRGGTMLFNLKEDIGEQKDLAASNPAKLKELQTAFEAWDKQMMPAKWIRQDRRNAEPGGKLKDQPAPRKRTGRSLQEIFRNADRDGDGRLSAEEFPQPRVFQNVDANGDGFATLEEVRAYYQSRQDRQSEPQEETPAELAKRTWSSWTVVNPLVSPREPCC
jgi:hypothetical protein